MRGVIFFLLLFVFFSFAESRICCVGIGKYKDAKFSPLPSAEPYAGKIANIFSEKFGKQQVVVLLGEKATHRKIRHLFKTFFSGLGKEDKAVVYYAAHGMGEPGKGGFLAAYDTDLERLTRLISMLDLVSMVRDYSSVGHLVIFLETCRSGVLKESYTQALNSWKKEKRHLEVSLFLSGPPDEDYPESLFLQAPCFSYFLYQALKGRADHNKDGCLSLFEIRDYISRSIKNKSYELRVDAGEMFFYVELEDRFWKYPPVFFLKKDFILFEK